MGAGCHLPGAGPSIIAVCARMSGLLWHRVIMAGLPIVGIPDGHAKTAIRWPNSSQLLQVDRSLAQHYGFTDEALNFIIDYDIKYRMGLTSRQW